MLDKFRSGAGNWLGKGLLGLLVLAFALWGVGDMVRNIGADTAIEIGGKAVSGQRYQQMFNRELSILSRQVGQQLTVDQGRSFGLDRKVMQQLLVDHHAGEINLGISQDTVVEKIAEIPGVKNKDGTFNTVRFNEMLRNFGFSEAGFIEYQREGLIRGQLVSTISAPLAAPKVAVEATNRFQNEERVLDWFVVNESHAAKPAEPTEAKLKEFYESRLGDYEQPELRKIGLIEASPTALRSTIILSDADLQKEYDRRKGQFGTPETRKLQQISFKDRASADVAFKELSGGKDFLVVAKANGATDKDIELGVMTKEQLLDQKIAEKAFTLEKGKVSEPIEGAFATVIVRAIEVTPATQKSFDEVKADLAATLAREQVLASLPELRTKIEDERAKGRSLKEIAPDFKLTYRDVGPFDRAGKKADGSEVTDVPGLGNMLKAISETEIGVEIDPVDVGENGLSWIEVKEITPKRQKTFDEVKVEVRKAWEANEIRASLARLAQDLADRAGKGEAVADLAKGLNLTATTSAPLKRGAKDKDLTTPALALAFSLAKGAASSAPGADSSSRLVFRVADVIAAKPLEGDNAKQLAANIGEQMSGDIVNQYVASLQAKYGLSFNETVMRQILGQAGDTQQP